MKQVIWLICATVMLSWGRLSYAQKVSFCSEEESPIFTCQLMNGKLASICGSPDLSEKSGSIRYIYGTKDQHVEISLPKDPATFRQNLTISEMNNDATGEDDEYLRFRNGLFSYVVYTGIGNNFDAEGVAVFKRDKLLKDIPCVKATSEWRLVFNSILSFGVPEEDSSTEKMVWMQLLPSSSFVHSSSPSAKTK